MKLKTFSLSATALLTAALPANVAAMQSAEDKYYVGASLGVNFPLESDIGNQFSDDAEYEADLYAAGVVGYRFAPKSYGRYRAELEAFYRNNDIDDNLRIDNIELETSGEVEVYGLFANLYLDFENDNRRITPFIGLGLGAAEIDADITAGNVVLNDSDTVFAYQGIAGARYDLNDKWSVIGDLRYVGVDEPDFTSRTVDSTITDEFEYDAVTTSIGVQYRF